MTKDGRISLLFVSAVDLSEQSGAGVATKETVAAFGKHEQIDLTLLCPAPSGRLPPKVKANAERIVEMSPKRAGITGHLHVATDTLFGLNRAFKLREPDLIVARHHPTMVAPPLYAKFKNVPYYLLARGTSHRTLRFSSLLTQAFRLNIMAATGVYTASEKIAADAKSLSLFADPTIRVIHNGVNPDVFTPQEKQKARGELDVPVREHDYVVGYVGTLHEYHALPELIKAIDLVDVDRPVKLLIVGDGPEMDRSQRLVERLNLEDQVIFTGLVGHDEVPTYISACDAMYGALKKNSATPIKVYEYLACERQIIINRLSEMSFMDENDFGVVIETITPNTVAQAIESLYKERSSCPDGRRYVEENNTWSEIVEGVLADFKK